MKVIKPVLMSTNDILLYWWRSSVVSSIVTDAKRIGFDPG